MPAPLLFTKLYIPPTRPNIVLRPRLIERLNEGIQRKLSLISAPAGFGKTTLVSEWVAGCKQPVAWLSLDEGDNDPVRFISYLVAALQTIKAGIGEGLLAVLQSPQPPQTEAILTTLLNEISAIPEHFLLILDDYHTIDGKSVDQALTFLIEHQPPHMHTVIATREDPSLPLSRLRARGQLTELRAADLRFTPGEAAEFLNRVMELNLSAEDIAALEARTEGWIAGLQLAALSMQSRKDIASFIQAFTGSHRFVLDYLVEEVLRHQPEPVRCFLMQTAILVRLYAPLCDAVTGQEDGKEMLDLLDRNNLFLIPLDDQRQWYRYHPLFAEVLITRLIDEQPDQVFSLHQRASKWYERNGSAADAIRHALAAKDFERAAGLIELAGPAAETGGVQQTTWLGWVKALPEGLVLARPVLNVWFAYALLGRGEMEAAEARFNDAERKLEPTDMMKGQRETPSVEMVVVDQDQWKSLPATIAIGRAYIAQTRGNTQDTVRYANMALDMPEADPFRHSQAAMLLGMTHWASGDLEAAGRVFADYTLKLRADGNLPDAISTTVVLANIQLALGRLHKAIDTVELCLHFVMDLGEPVPFDTADLHRELSELYLEQGNMEAAAHHFQKAKELGEKAQLPVLRYRLYITQARLNQTLADLDGALEMLDQAERLYIRSPLPDLCPISTMKARIWVVQGKLAKALEWVNEQGLSPDDDLCYLHEYEHITLARVLIIQYQNDRIDSSFHKAMRLLDRLLQAAEEGGRIGSVVEILVLQALAYQAQGDITPAHTSLERALTLAEPEGYIRIFTEEGEPIRSLIADLKLRIEKLRHDPDRKLIGYADKLLAAFSPSMVGLRSTSESQKSKISLSPGPEQPGLGWQTGQGDQQHLHSPAPASGAGVPQVQVSTMVEPLSDRELEVLRLLRTELNGPEIARELVISLNTVRTHTQNIYAKLGVNNRRAAVRRAEELDLL